MSAVLEIAGIFPEVDIGGERRHRNEATAEILKELGQEKQPGGKKRQEREESQRGKDAPGAPFIKIQDGKAAVGQFIGNDAGDQKAGNDKEDIDADESARKTRNPGVKQEDRKDGDRPQTIDFRSILDLGMAYARAEA